MPRGNRLQTNNIFKWFRFDCRTTLSCYTWLMNQDAITTLSPMQKTCLRLVYDHLQTKEIARQLGVSNHTVESHIKSARARLGATSRLDAARMLVSFEEGQPPPQRLVSQSIGIPNTPEVLLHEGVISGVSGQEADRLRPFGSGKAIYQFLPLPKTWGERNDLTRAERLLWMVVLTIFICLSLGAVITSLETLAHIF
jgi:DNA-binding CsgD family transcriptional regulator